MLQVRAPLTENHQFSNGNHILTVQAPEIARQALPGQFVMAAAATEGSIPYPLLKRALAVYSVSEDRSSLRLLLKVIGEGTRRLSELRNGEALELVGPLGNGFDLERGRGRLNLLVVGGTGIASVLLLARKLLDQGDETILIYGGRTGADLVGLDDFIGLEIPVLVTTEDGSRGTRGLVTDALRETLNRNKERSLNVYTCGPNAMMEAVWKMAEPRSVPCQVSVEVKMACGFGVCLGCTVKTTESYRLACTHGPVFNAETFIWEKSR